MKMLVFCISCFLVGMILRVSGSAPVDDYAVVIDAGSTGSRCFVFHVVIDQDDQREVTSASCGKVIPGLSSFVAYPNDASSYLAPLLHNAASLIPSLHHISTSIFIKATAGMRLLPQESQTKLWESVVRGINSRADIPFVISNKHIGTIDGHAEAFYAVLASNYVHGSIDGNLQPTEGSPMLGALDMGGSSTQLIFYNGTNDSRKIHADDFWSHSWLNFGVHRVHERVLDYLYSSYLDTGLQTDTGGSEQKDSTESTIDLEKDVVPTEQRYKEAVIPNPCDFAGHRHPYKSLAVFEGTGQGKQCMDIIEKVIWPTITNQSDINSECFRGRPCPIDEIEHPSVQGHHFYAMSVYFYALDCMRQLGPGTMQHWPKPPLDEVESVAMQFCGMQWEALYEEFSERNPHPYTRENQLADRCFEVLYIITLLEKGFGFDRHDHSITFAQEIEGSEVEWTLGFALAEIDFRPHHDKMPSVYRNGWTFLLAGKATELLANVLRFSVMAVKSYSRSLLKRAYNLLGRSFS